MINTGFRAKVGFFGQKEGEELAASVRTSRAGSVHCQNPNCSQLVCLTVRDKGANSEEMLWKVKVFNIAELFPSAGGEFDTK